MVIIDDIIIGVALSSIASAIGNRVASRVIMTPFEKSQVKSVEVQQSRLEQDARHHRERLRAERDNLERQLAHREKMAQVDHGLRIDAIDHEHGYRSWPLRALPGEILAESARYHGSAINVFVHVSANVVEASLLEPAEARTIKAAVDQQVARLMRLRDWLAENYCKTSASHAVIPYFSSNGAMQLAPQDMVAKLRRFLPTEPSILVFAELIDPRTLVCTVEVWGIARDEEISALGETRHADVCRMITFDLSRFEDAVRPQAREAALKSCLASLIDLAHLIYRLDQRPLPVAHRILGDGVRADSPALSEPCTRYLEAAGAADPLEAASLMADICRRLIEDECLVSAQSALAASTKTLGSRLTPSWTPSDWSDLSGLPRPGPADAAPLIRTLTELRQRIMGEPPDAEGESTRLSVADVANRLGARHT